VANPNREQLISFSGKNPERYYTGCVKRSSSVSWMNNVYRTGVRLDLFLLVRGGRREGTVLQVGRSRVRFPMVNWNFSLTYFLGGKGGLA
jgi:hypothetical protein